MWSLIMAVDGDDGWRGLSTKNPTWQFPQNPQINSENTVTDHFAVNIDLKCLVEWIASNTRAIWRKEQKKNTVDRRVKCEM